MDKIKYWIELTEYDIDTAETLLQGKRHLYVGFMCHQIIEKMLKAYWSSVREDPPLKIHHLSRLASNSGLIDLMDEKQLALIDSLEPLNIEARYPSYKEDLLKALTPEYCKNLLMDTKELAVWIKDKL